MALFRHSALAAACAAILLLAASPTAAQESAKPVCSPPCQNGGECRLDVSNPQAGISWCRCPSGFTGIACSLRAPSEQDDSSSIIAPLLAAPADAPFYQPSGSKDQLPAWAIAMITAGSVLVVLVVATAAVLLVYRCRSSRAGAYSADGPSADSVSRDSKGIGSVFRLTGEKDGFVPFQEHTNEAAATAAAAATIELQRSRSGMQSGDLESALGQPKS